MTSDRWQDEFDTYIKNEDGFVFDITTNSKDKDFS